MKLIQVILFCFFGQVFQYPAAIDSTLNETQVTKPLNSQAQALGLIPAMIFRQQEVNSTVIYSQAMNFITSRSRIRCIWDPLNVIRPFNPVYFGFDQYNISASERDKLVEIAEFLQNNQEARLLVEGYCDWKGTPAYNKALGERRATTVKEYLIELGADGSRVETFDWRRNRNSKCKWGEAKLDRRASFVVTKSE